MVDVSVPTTIDSLFPASPGKGLAVDSALTTIKTYESESIRGRMHQDEFDLSFVADARGRVLYSVSLADSSNPGRIHYISLGVARQQLRPVDLERVLTDVITGYFNERELSGREVRELNSELYQQLWKDLIGV